MAAGYLEARPLLASGGGGQTGIDLHPDMLRLLFARKILAGERKPPAGYLAGMRKVLPTLQTFCLDGTSFFQISSSGQEKGCFGVGLGVFCVRKYP